ncbi:MAG: hypothetical protein U0V02_07520 [Anaerolineales bacterium]
MKSRFFFWILSLVAVLVASACASTVTDAPTAPPTIISSATFTAVETPIAATASVVTVQAVATSRGPNLEATDPSTVKLASGQLQLVEFFRFT